MLTFERVELPTGVLVAGGGEGFAPAPPPTPGLNQSGSISLINGQAYISVTFPMAMPNANWRFIELRVINTVDPTPLDIYPGLVTARTNGGFTVQLTGLPDSNNYSLEWSIGIVIPPLGSTGDEGNLTPIPSGQSYLDVTFATVKGTPDWEFIVGPYVDNIVDDNTHPLINVMMISRRTTSGFRVLFNSAPDTANYKLRWRINAP